MELETLIHEIKKGGTYTKKDSYTKLINALRKDKQLRKKLRGDIPMFKLKQRMSNATLKRKFPNMSRKRLIDKFGYTARLLHHGGYLSRRSTQTAKPTNQKTLERQQEQSAANHAKRYPAMQLAQKIDPRSLAHWKGQ